MWESSKFFSDKYISIGWNLNFANSFPHCDYVACDTETKLYYDGELLSEDKAYELYRDNGQKWVRNNLEVKAYAFMISDGENFALFQNATDFLTCLSMLRRYNARISRFTVSTLRNIPVSTNSLTACGIPPTIRYCRNRVIALRCIGPS